MTDAELLRQAAALMRQRAQAATPGTWESLDSGDRLIAWKTGPGGFDDDFDYVVDEPLSNAANAEHIAAIGSPAVALAVADWLDASIPASARGRIRPEALAVARAYLRTDGSQTADEPGESCAGCGDRIPPGTPPYAADLAGTGRLCRDCVQRCEGGTDDLAACHDCPGGPLFGRNEIAEHRQVAHSAPDSAAGEA